MHCCCAAAATLQTFVGALRGHAQCQVLESSGARADLGTLPRAPPYTHTHTLLENVLLNFSSDSHLCTSPLSSFTLPQREPVESAGREKQLGSELLDLVEQLKEFLMIPDDDDSSMSLQPLGLLALQCCNSFSAGTNSVRLFFLPVGESGAGCVQSALKPVVTASTLKCSSIPPFG